MNITVLGATGMAGSRLVTEAVARGHRVTAAARHPHGARSAAVIPVTVDVGAPADQRDAALGTADAALLAIRTGTYRRGTTTLLTEPDGTSRISAEDLAVAALDEIEHPRGDRHFTVARSRGERPCGTVLPHGFDHLPSTVPGVRMP
ncbi:NAD-dependent epimerase/dehydratase family protein [Streptomyces sp. NBC_00342]|uniref:NAD-dependent epimerase/dehydratase family protein n=1 Tax=Streptomyces sp. NBC_00342 TaxID=2975718 RepID=UPI002E2A1913|nr:NAD-dependent epimerase/dehydratase family protein [Streptomyces sp. NBC_00342]